MGHGRVAIVTGGASGIGRALCLALGRRGGSVVVADRQIGLAEEVAHGVRHAGGKALAAELDVREFESVRDLADRTERELGDVDYLFNNAGIAVGGEIAEYDLSDWEDVLDVNVRGVVYGIQAVYPRMIARRRGHIINTASMAGLIPATEGSYTGSKYAVVGISKMLRIDARRHGVRVSVLCPGPIRTPILTGGRYGRIKYRGATSEKLMAIWEQMRPMEPEEFATKALRAIDRNEAIIVLPRLWAALWYLERLSPTLSSRMMGEFNRLARRRLELDD